MTDEVEIRGEPLSEPIYWTGSQWAVTAYGIECRDGTYSIEKERIWEEEGVWGWEKHMQGKHWVNMADFRAALRFAREHWPEYKPKGPA